METNQIESLFYEYLDDICEIENDDIISILNEKYNNADNKMQFVYAVLFSSNTEVIDVICKLNTELSFELNELVNEIDEINQNGCFSEEFKKVANLYGFKLETDYEKYARNNVDLYSACIVSLYKDKENEYLIKYYGLIKKTRIFIDYALKDRAKAYSPILIAYYLIIRKQNIAIVKDKLIPKEALNEDGYFKIKSLIDSFEQPLRIDKEILFSLINSFLGHYYDNDIEKTIDYINHLFKGIIPDDQINSLIRDYCFGVKQSITNNSNPKEHRKYSLKDRLELNLHRRSNEGYELDGINTYSEIDNFIKKQSYNGVSYIPNFYQCMLYMTSSDFKININNEEDEHRIKQIEKYYELLSEDDVKQLTSLLLEKEFFNDKSSYEYFFNSSLWKKLPECKNRKFIEYLYKHFDDIYYLTYNYKNKKAAHFTKRLSTSKETHFKENSSNCLIYHLSHNFYFTDETKLNDFINHFNTQEVKYLNEYDLNSVYCSYKLYSLYIKYKENGSIEKYHLNKNMFREYTMCVYCLMKNNFIDNVEKCDELIEASQNHKPYLNMVNELMNIKTNLINNEKTLNRYGINPVFEYEYKENSKTVEIDNFDIYLKIKSYIKAKKHSELNILINAIIASKNTDVFCKGILFDIKNYSLNYPYLNYIKANFKDRLSKNKVNKDNFLEYIEICSTLGLQYELDCFIKDSSIFSESLFEAELQKSERNINALLYIASVSENDRFNDFINMDFKLKKDTTKESYINYLVKKPLRKRIEIFDQKPLKPNTARIKDLREFDSKFDEELQQIKFDSYLLQNSNTPLYEIDSLEDIDYYIYKFIGFSGVCRYSNLFERYDEIHYFDEYTNGDKWEKYYLYDYILFDTNKERQGKILYFLLKIMSEDININTSDKTIRRCFANYSLKNEQCLNEDFADKLIKLEIELIDRLCFSDDKTVNYYSNYEIVFKKLYKYLLVCCYNNDSALYLKKKKEVISKYKELYNNIEKSEDEKLKKIINYYSIFSNLDEIQNVQNKNTKYTKQNFKRKY